MKYWMIALLGFAWPAFAQQTYTGIIKDLTGAPVTSGRISFTLAPSTDVTVSGSARFVPTIVSCSISPSGAVVANDGVSACSVTANTALSPPGTSYRICIQPNFSTPGSCFYDYALGGTKDISTVAPTLNTGPINYGGVPGPVGPLGPRGIQGPISNGPGTFSGTAAALSTPWGYTPQLLPGAEFIGTYDTISSFPNVAAVQVQRNYTTAADIAPDFTGAAGASLPIAEVEGTCAGGHNLQCQALSGYMVNNGSQDSIGVSGRVVRNAGATSATSGIADGAGAFSSAYNFATTPGAVMGGEQAIYSNVAGFSGATDKLTDHWAVSDHMLSASTGERATAVQAMDSAPGTYGAWNGILIDGDSFDGKNGAPSQGDAGTVGINGGSWNSTNGFPETGIKLGVDVNDIWQSANKPMDLTDAQGIFAFHGGNVATPTTPAGLNLFAGTGTDSYVSYFNGTKLVGNIAYNSTLNYFAVNSIGAVDTHINPNGGNVFVPPPPISDNTNLAATTAFVQATSTPLYTSTGAEVNNAHSVTGVLSLTNGAGSVTLSGKSIFTNQGTYFCWITGGHHSYATQNSGISFNITGYGSDIVSYFCIGN